MLQPAHPTYRKAFKGRVGKGFQPQEMVYGDYGLRACENGRLTARQLESARRSLRRALARTGLVWRRVFPAMPVTGKPTEVRRGKGKGGVAFWAVRVRPGTRLFEVGGAGVKSAPSLLAAAHKLPMATRICVRREALK